MNGLPECIDGLLNLYGSEAPSEKTLRETAGRHLFLPESRVNFSQINSACAIARRERCLGGHLNLFVFGRLGLRCRAQRNAHADRQKKDHGN